MATFKYVAKDASARNVNGKIAAEDQQTAIDQLRKKNLTVISVAPVKEAALSKMSFARKKVKADDLVMFARQLATMVEAGIPILQALDALQEQTSHTYFKGVISAIRDDIQLGSSLSAGFAKHTSVFDQLFINMVKVGETGGVLSEILDRIAAYMEKSIKLQRKVKSAMIYPAVVVTMAIGITMLLLWKVVPTFAAIYSSFDQELPFMTKILIDVSNLVNNFIGYMIGGFFLAGFLLGRYYRTEQGRLVMDRASLKMPIFGDLIRKVAISRFSRTLATLIQSGVPILEALDIVGRSCGNKVIEIVVDNVKNSVREGESIAGPLTKSGVFPPMVTRMISIGEKSGKLEKMLNKIAEFYDDQVDAIVSGLTSIIEPVIIGFLGIVVGFIVIALFLPIINITQII
ncbi:MAG: type II secretion system F family protein [Candidatus Omnitrophota bacterium]|nr:type II secretion system F family protein [Candidatus Omnitrophota bacterium]MDZ4241926.1 type II secretion system F family protein [Candidatus Omnitrophota bacterium]